MLWPTTEDAWPEDAWPEGEKDESTLSGVERFSSE